MTNHAKINYAKIYNWSSFIIYADIEKQIEIIQKLKTAIKKFRHYNFNYYNEPFSKPHVSIRVQGWKYEKQKIEQKIIELGYDYEIKEYDAIQRKAYEFGTRCAFIYDDYKHYFYKDGLMTRKNFLFCALHGLLDNLAIGEKEEGRLHLKMAWHFLVKKPWYKFKWKLFKKRRISQARIWKFLSEVADLLKKEAMLRMLSEDENRAKFDSIDVKIKELEKKIDKLLKK